MQANGGNVLKASRELGIPRRSIYAWQTGERRRAVGETALQERASLMQQERSKMAKLWLKVTYKAIKRLDRTVETLKGRDLILLAGLGTDKHIALTGGARSTQDVNVTVTLADLYRKHLPRNIVDVAPIALSEGPKRTGSGTEEP